MAYDIHIFRGNDWWKGTTDPITAEELLSVEGVKSANNVTSTNPQTGVEIKVASDGLYSYKEAYVMLRKGMITVAARNEDAIEVVRPLAEALGAVIQGDEGEFY
jgi:hypothetical protein